MANDQWSALAAVVERMPGWLPKAAIGFGAAWVVWVTVSIFTFNEGSFTKGQRDKLLSDVATIKTEIKWLTKGDDRRNRP